MKGKMIHEADGKRTYVVVLGTGNEVRGCLGRLAERERLSAAQVTAIGAFERATIRFFDWDAKDHLPVPV